MTISEKLFQFMSQLNIDQKEFAKNSDISTANFNHKLGGRVKFNEEDFRKIKRAYPQIDLNYLIVEDELESSPNEKTFSRQSQINEDLKLIMEIVKKNIF